MAPDNAGRRLRIRALASVGSDWETTGEFPLEPRWGRLRNWFLWQAEKEVLQRRLFPWLAVLFGLGILLFFSADGRPGAMVPFAAAAIFGAAGFLARRSFGLSLVLVAIAALCSGFTAAAWRTGTIGTIGLSRVVITPVSGFIEAIGNCPGSLLTRLTDHARL